MCHIISNHTTTSRHFSQHSFASAPDSSYARMRNKASEGEGGARDDDDATRVGASAADGGKGRAGRDEGKESAFMTIGT